MSLLRLPKHLQESARADNAITVEVTQRITATSGQETEAKTESAADDYTPSPVTQLFKQEHFQESEGDHDEDDDEYENDYDGYYNEVEFQKT